VAQCWADTGEDSGGGGTWYQPHLREYVMGSMIGEWAGKVVSVALRLGGGYASATLRRRWKESWCRSGRPG